MKKKILSLTAAVAAVITTTGIIATNNESIAKLASKSEIIEKAGQELLILPPVNKNSSNTIAHSSHASHGSHGSHASHSSHYSGR